MSLSGNSLILPSDRVTLGPVIHPDSYSAGAVSTAWLSVADFFYLMAILAVGDMVSTSTINAKLEQAQDDSGTGAKDVDGKAITELDDTNGQKQVLINCRPDELDANNDFTHVRLTVTVANAASELAAILQGFDTRDKPAEQPDSVVETLTNQPIE